MAKARKAAPPRADDARTLRSRGALRQALLDLVEHHPFEAITIREITDCAGVGQATFYRHYPTKSALLEDVAASEIRDLVALSLPILQARNTGEACLATVRYVEHHRSLWQALLTGGAASRVREEFVQIALDVNYAGHVRSGWIPTDLACRFTASAMVEILTWWLECGDTVCAEDAARLLDQLVASPVVTSPR